ncbi:MAG TPA: hypothetical protein VMF61_00210 [Candidatus Acidoferrales bacterium]|nr:hypothetical protein [Candidatus Acidoferrales bacterium]
MLRSVLAPAFAFVTLSAVAAGCSTSSGAGALQSFCSQTIFEQLLYPKSFSKVSPNVGVLILAGNETVAPILQATGGAIVQTQLSLLPSPLPQPEATRRPGATTTFAVSVPALQPKTIYVVRAPETLETCSGGSSTLAQLGYISTR